MKDTVNISDAFDQYLKELALNEFPSGEGNWRNNLAWRSDLLEASELTEDANLYTVESLKDFANNIPFQKQTQWNHDAMMLQDQSVEKPQSVAMKNIHKYFKQLRIVGKNVSNVDDQLLKFENLEELTLSVNKIQQVSSIVLPKGLKVLELCGNEISDIGSLCVQPPLLEHLGLSYNHIISIADFIKPHCWQCLLSLDLSSNSLEDIVSTVGALLNLPKLRNLLLQGNPLYFFVGYHGYVIDSIKSLSLLDDVRVSADERHHYKGLSKLKGLPYNQFAMAFKMDLLNGLVKMEEENLMDEFPKTVIKYHIEIDFIENYKLEDHTFLHLQGETETSVVIEDLPDEVFHHQPDLMDTTVSSFRTNEFCCMSSIHLNFYKIALSENTRGLKHCLQNKLQLRIIENAVVVSNEPKHEDDDKMQSLASENGGSVLLRDKSSGQIGKSRSKGLLGKKDTKDGKTKTKAKLHKQDAEMFEWARTKRTIATSEIDCQTLLEGVSILDKECVFTRIPTLQPAHSKTIVTDDSKKTLDPKRKYSKDIRKGFDRPVSSFKSVRSKSIIKNEQIPVEEVTEEVRNEETILTLQFHIEMLRWKTAKEALLWTQRFGNQESE